MPNARSRDNKLTVTEAVIEPEPFAARPLCPSSTVFADAGVLPPHVSLAVFKESAEVLGAAKSSTRCPPVTTRPYKTALAESPVLPARCSPRVPRLVPLRPEQLRRATAGELAILTRRRKPRSRVSTLPTLSTSRLEISPTPGETSTFPQRRPRGRIKTWKTQRAGFHYPTAPIPHSHTTTQHQHRRRASPAIQRKETPAAPRTVSFQAHLAADSFRF
jgi:hypothetical protein